ncbi:MAG: hypothetical protein QM534_10520 [Sediminibacterium sp.]|nr:hypothetical protein [Sediminibacterium sp.]
MKNAEVNGKTEQGPVQKTENLKGIENHKKAAAHFESAAKHHLEAAKHHESGNHEKAAKSTIEAHGHANLAHEAQKEDTKHHAPKI